MQKSALLTAIQREIQNHDLTQFVDAPPSIAHRRSGIVITGCSRCRKRFGTVSQKFRRSTRALSFLRSGSSRRFAVATLAAHKQQESIFPRMDYSVGPAFLSASVAARL